MPRRQDNTDLEAPQADTTAAPAIPSDTQADVTVKFKTRVDPNLNQGTRRELEDLTALAEDNEEPPPDDISAFCYHWQNFAGYPLSIIRLPDPPERRMAGNSYARPCFNLERLGDTTFDPSNLIGTLQFVNHNSGGVFRIWLTDHNGAPIPAARVERIAIGDPPRSAIQPPLALPQPPPYQPPPPHEKSESEKQLETVKDTLFQTALTRALNPPTPSAISGAPGSQLPPEDQATLFLLGKTDFLGNIFGKMADLAAQTANVTKEPSWKERAIDAGLQLATNNPAIVDRLSGVVERIIARVLPDPRYDTIQPPPQQFVYQQPQPPPQPNTFTPDPGPPDAPIDEDDDEDMDIIEALTALLNSDRPLTIDEPIFKELETAYPKKFHDACNAIARFPIDMIINWIANKGGPVYASMFSGPVSGPYLRQRLTELQTLIIAAQSAAKERKATQTKDAKPTQTDEANAQANS